MKWRSLEESSKTDTRPLREIFAERKALIARYVPPETQAIHLRVIEELKARGLAAQVLKPGEAAPSFELPDQNGKLVCSKQLLACGRLVICFIRGRWCPFCVGQMEAMNLIASAIRERGASLIAVSPQTVQQSYFMHDQHKLNFPLLRDKENVIARQFGLTYQVPDYQQVVYKRVFVNLPHANGDASWELPIPATFVVDQDCKVLFAAANEDYGVRPEPAEILPHLS